MAANDLIPVSPYRLWSQKQGIPEITGEMFDAVNGQLELAYWDRKGVPAALLRLRGSQEVIDGYVLEIPPGGETLPDKYMFDEQIVALSGSGDARVWTDNGPSASLSWSKGTLFSPPINTWRQIRNTSQEVARLLVLTNAPVIFNLFRSESFIFENDHVFHDKFDGKEDFFTRGEQSPGMWWRANRVDNIYDFKLQNYSGRGAGGTGVMFDAGTLLQSHIAQFPVGTYKMSHRHGAGAHILILSGSGYSLLWEEGKPRERIDWGPGSVFVPPDMWFHQHFNTSSEPARYFAVHYGYWRVLVEDLGPESIHIETGHQIAYQDEDPTILKEFEAELRKNGVSAKPANEWRK